MMKNFSLALAADFPSSFTSSSTLKVDQICPKVYLIPTLNWFNFRNFWLNFIFTLAGDSIFTAGKPAILANNTLIRGSKALNNRRPITSSSSTISSQSNDTGGKERKDKAIKDSSMQQRYMMDSGN